MGFERYLYDENELPLDKIIDDGGYAAIFRSIACVGDSLSSGEFEVKNESGVTVALKDIYEYSWGQFLGRMIGSKVYNFSAGGLTASAYVNDFAERRGCWDKDKACQCYIIALGHNDLYWAKPPVGSKEDIDFEDYNNNAKTFFGNYAKIIQRYKEIQPNARFFLITMPYGEKKEEYEIPDQLAEVLYTMAEIFTNTYVIDLRKYGPVHDKEFKEAFYLGGHLNAAGYIMSAKQIASYMDYIIRHNIKDFLDVPFIGN